MNSNKIKNTVIYFILSAGFLLGNVSDLNAQTEASSQTYVLVHGAWHGGWCWQEVSEKLREENKMVYTPTLSGLGEHKNTLNKDIDLETHIQDIVNLIEMEDLTNVILVGHSYAGLVIAGVADRISERLEQLVFLDAVIVEDGQSALSVQQRGVQKAYKSQVNKIKDTRVVPVITAENFGVKRPEKIKSVNERLTPQPYKTFTQPLHLKNPFGNGLPLTYIACSNPELDVLKPMIERIKKNTAWQFYSLDSGHDAMIIMPDEVSELFISLEPAQDH